MKTNRNGNSGVCLAVLLAIIGAAVLCGCTFEKPNNPDDDYVYHPIEGLDEATVRQIVRDVGPIGGYLGTYDGWITVIQFAFGDIGRGYVIADVLFSTGIYHFITVWKNGEFYTLHEAYDTGIITSREDLRSMARYLYGAEINLKYHAGNCGSSFGMEWTWYDRYASRSNPDISVFDVRAERFYGYYGERTLQDFRFEYRPPNSIDKMHYAVMMHPPVIESPEETITVAGITFRFPDKNPVLLSVYNENYTETKIRYEFYTLQEAYDLELLDKDDLETIAYYHETETWLQYRPYRFNSIEEHAFWLVADNGNYQINK